MADVSTTLLQGCVDRMNAGHPSARDELIQHTYERLRRLTHRMFQDFSRLKPWADADDVLQNALVRLLRALEAVPLDSGREFFRLASTQIRRELLDLTRHCFGPEGSGIWRADAAAADGWASAAGPAPDKQDSSQDAARLARWSEFHLQVEALPMEEREVVSLVWYHGMTQAEAAAVLNVSIPTIKRWWLSARLRLQEALHGDVPTS